MIRNDNRNALIENEKYAANKLQREGNQADKTRKGTRRPRKLKLYSQWSNGTFTSTTIMKS
jgi:hypothetical protein